MAGHACAGKCDAACDDNGLRDSRRQVDAVHWSGHGTDAAYQEEVCGGRLPSWRGCQEEDFIQEPAWASFHHDHKLFREGSDQIEYPSELASLDQAWAVWLPNDAKPSKLRAELLDRQASYSSVEEDGGLLHLHFDLAHCDKEDRKSVHFVVLGDSGSLVVARVDPKAPLATTVFGEPGLACSDVILEVNGRSGTARELWNRIDEAFLTGSSVNILLQPRAASFDVEVKRTGRSWCKLGMQVALVGHTEVRVIMTRDSGLIPEWNATHGPSLQVLPGDRVTHVNGDSSSAKDMYSAMQEAVMGECLRLRIATPSRRRASRYVWLGEGSSPAFGSESTASGLSPTRSLSSASSSSSSDVNS